MSWVIPFAIALVAALLIKNFLIINADVPTGSMENTILPGDRFIGNRLAYVFGEPERGDIVSPIMKYDPSGTSNVYGPVATVHSSFR